MRQAVSILAVLLATFCMTGSGVAAEEIKVGFVDTYTGPATTFTNDVLDGFKLAAEKINAKGGVLGRKITWVTRDDKFKPDPAYHGEGAHLNENVDLLVGRSTARGPRGVRSGAEGEDPLLRAFSKSDKINARRAPVRVRDEREHGVVGAPRRKRSRRGSS